MGRKVPRTLVRNGGARPRSTLARSRGRRTTIRNILASSLRDYQAIIASGDFQLQELVAEAGLRCPRCQSGACARPHAWRFRKQVTDLSTGEVFRQLPILRICFCQGPTRSLMPAELWRGRSTVSSVLETVVHVLRDGMPQALEWTSYAGQGQELVSERTLRRWRQGIRRRLVGSAWALLGPQLGWSWSQQQSEADQLERVLEDLTAARQLAFRAVAGHAVLDQPSVTPPAVVAPSSARPVAGRLAAAPPPDPPSGWRRRGAWWPRNRRGPPPAGQPKRRKP